MRVFGVVLIIAGILALIYGGFSYTQREKVVDIGDLEATVNDRETFTIPPIAGGAAVLAGIIMVLADRRNGRRIG